VNVLNTTAELNGRRLLVADVAQDITGLKSFNRGTNPPFAVNAGAGSVVNLDADLLDGQDGAYYLSAPNLTGTIPDARFPAILPAISGMNLTDLNAANLASGVVPQARVGEVGTWVPIWTSGGVAPVLGNGTLVGNYTKVGRLVLAAIRWDAGGTTTYGNNANAWTFSLPVIASGVVWIGSALALTGGGSTYRDLVPLCVGGGTIVTLAISGTGQNVAQTTPVAWASGDWLAITMLYYTT
jgi:hypothetical protein